jgi:hypothetical protein
MLVTTLQSHPMNGFHWGPMTDEYILSCTVCEWVTSTTNGTPSHEVNNQAITHYNATGHTVTQPAEFAENHLSLADASDG